MTAQKKDFLQQIIITLVAVIATAVITSFTTSAKVQERVDVHTDQIKVLDEKKADKDQIIELLERNERYLIRIESKVDLHIKEDR